MPLHRIDYSFYSTNETGVTHYKTYLKHGSDFSGTGVPDNDYLISVVKAGTNQLYYEAQETGDYYLRFYSYNSDNRTISSSYSSASVTVTGGVSIQDYSVSTLRLKRNGRNFTNQSVKSGQVSELDPEFSWQVGNPDPERLKDNTEFRITVRPISVTSTPDNSIYYEITGYKPDISNPRFIYSYKQNVSASGGPYRNYDVVVETHDRNGDTSAGNSILSPRRATESWSNINGYDKISIFNNKPTGIWLTSGVNEAINGYQTKQWVDGERNLHIEIISGSIPPSIVAARIYYSKDYFVNSGFFNNTGLSISSGIGQSGVNYSNIEFNKIQDFRAKQHFSVPTNITNTGYVGVSFFDKYELNIFGNVENIPHGIDVCPIVPVYSTGSYHIMSVFNYMKLHNTGDPDQHVEIQYRDMIGDSGYHMIVMKDINDENIILSTFRE